jgi:predicted nucleotidyltransferase
MVSGDEEQTACQLVYLTIISLRATQIRLSKQRRRFLRGVKVTFLKLEPLLVKLKARAQQVLASHPEILEIGLFGSLVQGNYGPWSDAGLLVIPETDARRFVDRIPEFLEAFSGLGIPVDVFPYTVGEIAAMRDAGFVKAALAERPLLASRAAPAT